MITPEQLAKLIHATQKTWCDIIPDAPKLPNWDDAPEWMRESSLKQANAHIDAFNQGKVIHPEEDHNLWMQERLAQGWRYGPVRDEVAKTNPALVPYQDLPQWQKYRDTFARALCQEAWILNLVEEVLAERDKEHLPTTTTI